MSWPKVDVDREDIIDRLCTEAIFEAQETGEMRKVTVCAGPPWCVDGSGFCDWCTRVIISPDGRMSRSEPGHA